MANVFNTLKDRGYIAQLTHEDSIRSLLENEKVTFYIGFDPTADSLHVGHFLQLMVMAHMQKAGHRPIAIIGGATAMVGDPTGKTDMRKMLTYDEICNNAQAFKEQMSSIIDFKNGRALMLNNSDWLLELKYVNFLRDIGVHFSVNRMLSAECFKSRLEKGLSFIEFNYMLMQSYDFLKLYQQFGCVLQLGGDDQWSNIIGGIELIRKVEGKEAYGMTFNLLTTSEGRKMGKTEKGAIWLDPQKTSPYDFYQYWRNVDDRDVVRCLKLLTFIPLQKIMEFEHLEGQQLNSAKQLLAYEVTAQVHGKKNADIALETAKSLFGHGKDHSDMPTTEISSCRFSEGMNIIDLMTECRLIPSKGEGRRLVKQGGVYMNDVRVDSIDAMVTPQDFNDSRLIIRRGKKKYHRVLLV